MALTLEQQATANRYANLRYHIKITPDECDGEPCFVATHFELVGCTAHGPTREAAVANVLEVRKEYIEILIEQGAEVPLPMAEVHITGPSPVPLKIQFMGPGVKQHTNTKQATVESSNMSGETIVEPTKSLGALTPEEAKEFEPYALKEVA